MAKSKYNVKIGDKFGHWAVIEVLGRGGKCLCECDCDNKTQRVIDTCSLYNGYTKSCGCSYKHQIKIGDVYSDNLKVLHKSEHKTKDGRTLYTCKCLNCGNEIDVLPKDLVSGHIKSCGCFVSKNGQSTTRLYSIWEGITTRCNNPKHHSYKYYGGRGIKCLWNSFEEFKEDMYESYLKHVEEFGEDDTSINRIDVSGNYCKENCEWATRKEQANNKTTTWLIEYMGKVQSASQWAEELGINYGTIKKRKYVYGYVKPEDILAKPHKASVKNGHKGVKNNDKTDKE